MWGVDVEDQAWRFSVDALVWAARQHHVGEMHPVLAGEPVHRDDCEDGALAQAARDEFIEAGAFDGNSLHPDVLHLVAALCRPMLEFYCWFTTQGRTLGMLSVELGQTAALAVREERTIALWQIPPAEVVTALVGKLPPVPAAQFPPVSLRATDIEAAKLVGSTIGTSAGIRLSVDAAVPPEVHLLNDILSWDQIGKGEFTVAVRGRAGRRAVAADPLEIMDTTRGRVHRLTTRHGREKWVLLAPAAPHNIAACLDEMRRSLSRKTVIRR